MNNKGFVVSTILYTILISFLLFLGVMLSIFASATSTVGGGTDDLVNATNLSIKQVRRLDASGIAMCEKIPLASITSKYGELYWPKNFGLNNNEGTLECNVINGNECISKKGNIEIKWDLDGKDSEGDEIVDYSQILNIENDINELNDVLNNNKKFYLYVIDTNLEISKEVYIDNEC